MLESIAACIGFFGANCSAPCPDGYYGFGCRQICNCNDTEICDPMIGCTHPKGIIHNKYHKHTLRPSVSLTTNVHRNNNSFFLNYKVSTPNAFDKEYIYNTLSTTKGINVCYNRYGNLYLSLSFYYI